MTRSFKIEEVLEEEKDLELLLVRLISYTNVNTKDCYSVRSKDHEINFS